MITGLINIILVIGIILYILYVAADFTNRLKK